MSWRGRDSFRAGFGFQLGRELARLVVGGIVAAVGLGGALYVLRHPQLVAELFEHFKR